MLDADAPPACAVRHAGTKTNRRTDSSCNQTDTTLTLHVLTEPASAARPQMASRLMTLTLELHVHIAHSAQPVTTCSSCWLQVAAGQAPTSAKLPETASAGACSPAAAAPGAGASEALPGSASNVSRMRDALSSSASGLLTETSTSSGSPTTAVFRARPATLLLLPLSSQEATWMSEPAWQGGLPVRSDNHELRSSLLKRHSEQTDITDRIDGSVEIQQERIADIHQNTC